MFQNNSGLKKSDHHVAEDSDQQIKRYKMKDNIDLSKIKLKRNVWLERLWGVLPLVFLIIVIVVLFALIKSKSDFLEAKKKGLHLLEGFKIASDNADEVMGIYSASDSVKDANSKLIARFDLSKRQASAVSQMRLADLTGSEITKREANIKELMEEMAKNNSDFVVEQPGINVVTMRLSPQTILDRINLPGTIDPWIELEVLTEVSAKVIKKSANEGDTVKKGDVIAILDSSRYENNYKSAKALYQSALSSYNRYTELRKEELSTSSQLDNSLAQVESYRAAMDNAEKDLKNCTIKAPISGIINKISIEEGQYLVPALPVAKIIQIDIVKVNVGIPESDVDAVRNLDHFSIRIDALRGKVFDGTKHYLSRSADKKARLYNLEIKIENDEGKILPDMFARVEIVKEKRQNAIVVPLYSLISFNSGHIVYIEDDGIAHRKKVELGLQEGWNIEVTKGIEPGDKMIVVGHRSVSDGQKISVVRSVTDPEELAK